MVGYCGGTCTHEEPKQRSNQNTEVGDHILSQGGNEDKVVYVEVLAGSGQCITRQCFLFVAISFYLNRCLWKIKLKYHFKFKNVNCWRKFVLK